MDGGHGADLLDLRFQGDAPVGLLVCRNPHVTNRSCFHSQNHSSTRNIGDVSYLGTVSGPLRSGKRPARTNRGFAPPSTRTAATAFHPGLRKAVAALPGLRSLAGVGGQPCAATTPAGGFVCGLAAAASVPRRPTQEKSSKAGQQHRRHRQQRSPPQKEGRETLRLVVASATEPGTWLFPTVRAAAKRCGRICGMAAAGPTPSGSQHTEPAATAATGPSKPCCGSCYSGRLEWMLWHRRAVFTSLRLSQGENNDEQAFIGDAPLICRNGFRRADLDRQDQR